MWLSSIYKPLLAAAILARLGVEASSQGRGPLSTIQVIDSPIIRTPSHRVHAHSEFDIEFEIKDKRQRVKLTLEPNHDLIPENAGISILNDQGEVIDWQPIDRSEHRIFRGTTWIQQREGEWDQLGWSRISVLQDGPDPIFEGSFSIMHDSHHIQLRKKFEQTRHHGDPSLDTVGAGEMILFRDSDTETHPWHGDLRKRDQSVLACPSDQLSFNSDPLHPVHMAYSDILDYNSANMTLVKRQSIDGSSLTGNAGSVNYASTIGSVQGCPSTRKVALVGVAVDCTYRAGFNTDNDTQKHVLGIFNQASQVYESTFNISLALRNLTMQPSNCPATAQTATPWNLGCSDSFNITSRLNSFSAWRGQFQDPNAYWMLLSNCTTGPEVGLSWLGQLCVNTVSTVGGQSTSGANFVARTSTEWQVVAHETGHMFGAIHDCDSTTCAAGANTAQQCCPLSTTTCNANAQFIMNPSTGTNIQSFSACTVGNICSAFYRKSVSSSCLVDNKGVSTLVLEPQCGNGIVEQGEECDCGGTQGCGTNSCCDPTTCKFINNAVCDDSNEQCCSGCQFATNGTVCRASTGVCDPQEVCPGNKAACPADQTAPDGQTCGTNLQCASGQCTSRDLQCKTLMGSLTTNNDTYACDSNSCTLLCASPEFPAGECYSMQQYFLDGTPCGSGKCSNGVCQGGSTGGDIQLWVNNNKPIVIGVCSGVGGLIVLLILICIVRRCTRKRYTRKNPSPTGASPNMSQQWPGAAGTWNAPQYVPPRYGGSPAHDGWAPPPPPNVAGYSQPVTPDQHPISRQGYSAPTTPGAAYDGRGSGFDQDGRRPPMFYGGNSVRYA